MPAFPPLQRCLHSRPVLFARFLWRRFNEVNIPLVSGSLTFTTLLALVPLFTVTVVVIAAFPMFSDISARFNDFLTSVIIPNAGADVVSHYLFEFREKASKLTAIGIIMMMLTSILLIQTIERTFNQIWHVRHTRPLWVRILVYWALLTLGPLALGLGLSVFNYVLGRSVLAVDFPLLTAITKIVSSVCVITLLLFLTYKVVPYRHVPANHALIGAFATAVLLESVRNGFGFYIAHFNSYQLVYGAFAAIPIFLLWLNLLWMILLSGAVFTAALSYWRGNAYLRPHTHARRFTDVLDILILLHEAQNARQTVNLRQLRRRICLGDDTLDDILTQLCRHGLVAGSETGWLLKTNAEHIRLRPLFHHFVYPCDNAPAADTGRRDTAGVLDTLLQPGLDGLDITLADFIAQRETSVPKQTAPHTPDTTTI